MAATVTILREMAVKAFDAATTVHLHTGDPGDDGTENRVSGGDYAGVSVAVANWTFTNGSDRVTVSNQNVVQFPTPTASWGTVNRFTLTKGTGQNAVYIGDGTLTARAIAIGSNTTIPAGDIDFVVRS